MCSINIERHLKYAAHFLLKYTSQQQPILLLPSVCLASSFRRVGAQRKGWSNQWKTGCRAGPRFGRRGGYIKTDRTQVVLYPPCAKETLNCSGSTSFTLFFFSLPFSLTPVGRVQAQDENGSIICTENRNAWQNVGFRCASHRLILKW